MTSSLVYVYAILSSPLSVEIRGIDAASVRFVTRGDLAAAVSDVPAEAFGEQALNTNVTDMAWLGPRAVAHQDVNAQLFERSEAIVPLAFGTVFHDDARVQEFLSAQSTALRQHLERVRDASEWVVALHLLRPLNPEDVAADSPMIMGLRQQIANSPPGRAHLLRQRLQTIERDESRRLQSEAAQNVLNALRAISLDVFREPLPTDAVEKPLLRASVLVRRESEADFMDEVDQLRKRWREPTYRLLVTGPWPPYRFAGLTDDAE